MCVCVGGGGRGSGLCVSVCGGGGGGGELVGVSIDTESIICLFAESSGKSNGTKRMDI